jgi:RNA polymerase sigma-70 factor (ECF subfamily)
MDARRDGDAQRSTAGPAFGRILQQAKRGEEAALERLYRDLAPSVLGYLRGQGAAEPEDLTSDVFVGMVRGLPRFEGNERGLRAWVFTIAHRRLLDERRRSIRRPFVLVDPHRMPSLPGPRGDTEEEAVSRLNGHRALGTLRSLTPEQRDVLLLRVIADLSVAQTAELLGKEEGAVKALQRRALARLARDHSTAPVS